MFNNLILSDSNKLMLKTILVKANFVCIHSVKSTLCRFVKT